MDLVPTDAEVAEAERIYKTAYDADFGRGYGMRRALESFLQGRAKPAALSKRKEAMHLHKFEALGAEEPAQEEITDDDFRVWLSTQSRSSLTHEEQSSTASWAYAGWCAAIRASKGEKT